MAGRAAAVATAGLSRAPCTNRFIPAEVSSYRKFIGVARAKFEFVSLMYWATSSVEFSFNDTIFRQVNVVAMGSPLGPMLANIFVGFHERRLFNESSAALMYHRYVDHTFAIFPSRQHFEDYLEKLNALHTSLKFTFETEVEGRLPFLDVLVHKTQRCFQTSVYRKPTFSGLYMNWESFYPRSRKTNLVKTLVHRAVRICSALQVTRGITIY